MSKISEYLQNIMAARYGEEVRGSIRDAIEECYEDVSAAKTIADDSATAASAAAASATSAAAAATSAAQHAVVYDSAQTLTDAQKEQARDNIGAAFADDVDDLKSAVNDKVGQQQGSENAGKALVVGIDGNVAPGDAGIPDAVKSALLACFEKVAWVDGNGQDYYDALEAALNGGVVPPKPEPEYVWRYTPADGLLSAQDYITKTSATGYSGSESVVNDELVLVDQRTTSSGGSVNTAYRFSTAEKCSLKCQFKCVSPFPYFSTTNPSSMGLRFQISNGVSGARVYIGALANTNTLMALWFDGNMVLHVVETNLLYADYHVIEMSIDGDRQNIKIDDVVIANDAALAISATINQGMIMQHTNVELMETYIKYIEFDDESAELYKLDSPRQFTGQTGDYIDTEVKLLDVDKDYTILVDANETNHDFATKGAYSIYGFDGENTTGFFLRSAYSYGNIVYTLGYGTNANPSNKYQWSALIPSSAAPTASNNHIRAAISHVAGSGTCVAAIKVNDTSGSIGGYDGTYNYVQYDGGDLIVAARYSSSSSAIFELFDGLINRLTVYGYAMSQDEINAFMSA